MRQKVAKENVSGLPGEHKFHFKDIPMSKMKVTDILHPRVVLMFLVANLDMEKSEYAKETFAMWHAKHLKFTT